jgi:hypothetical protein
MHDVPFTNVVRFCKVLQILLDLGLYCNFFWRGAPVKIAPSVLTLITALHIILYVKTCLKRNLYIAESCLERKTCSVPGIFNLITSSASIKWSLPVQQKKKFLAVRL